MNDDTHQRGPDSRELPPPPRRPDPNECCGSGCNPCIFDYYEQALERWQRRVEAIRNGAPDPDKSK